MKVILCFFVFAGSAFAQAGDGRLDAFKTEAPSLQSAVEEIVNSAVPGLPLLQRAKATYLEGYGVVVTLEATLEPPRNPFSSPQRSPDEVRANVMRRRQDIQEKLTRFLQERTGSLESLYTTESIAVIVHFFNSNPADLPDLPGQLVFTAKKEDSTRVSVRAY